MASIHLRPMEVNDNEEFLYLHGALGVGKNWRCAGIKTMSGHNLQGVYQNKIRCS